MPTTAVGINRALAMDTKQRRGKRKSDVIDAHLIAQAVVPLPVGKLRQPRLNAGIRQAIHILVTALQAMTEDRTPGQSTR